jgi:hypothetical protein
MVTEFSIAVFARLSQPRTNTECVLEMIESGKRRFENQIFGFAFTTSSSAGERLARRRCRGSTD